MPSGFALIPPLLSGLAHDLEGGRNRRNLQPAEGKHLPGCRKSFAKRQTNSCFGRQGPPPILLICPLSWPRKAAHSHGPTLVQSLSSSFVARGARKSLAFAP